ncbi:reverse transcriptase domain-containing protein [Tanacetum coccineum]
MLNTIGGGGGGERKVAKTVAPTPNSAIVQIDVDDNFVINSTHLKMILENKFDGYLQAEPHDHNREFLAICNMFKYGETQSEAVKLLIFPFSLCDEAKTWFNELNEDSITSWDQMRKVFINRFFPPSLRTTQGILDITAGGMFLYKSPNEAFQLLEDKVLFNLDWSTKSQTEHHGKYVAFADRSNSNNDNSRLMEKLKAMDSQIISLKEELQDMRNKYNNLEDHHASKNGMNDDTLMCERHEVNSIQSEGYQNRNSQDSYSPKSLHNPNDSEKLLTKLNNDVKNDLEDFKRCIRSMRTIHDKLFDRDDGKTTGVLPNKKSKPVNQEPQFKTDFEKLMTKFLDDQSVSNIKIDKWSKSQNVSSKQTDRTDPLPPQANTEQVNVVFTGNGKSDDSP